MTDRETGAKLDIRKGYCSVSIPDSWHSHEVQILQADGRRTEVARDLSQDIPILTLTLPRRVTQVRIEGRRYDITLEEPQGEIRVRETASEEKQDELVIEGRGNDGRQVPIRSLVVLDNLSENPGIIMGHVAFESITTNSMLFVNKGDTPERQSHSLVTFSRSTLGGIPTDTGTMRRKFSDVKVHSLEVTPEGVSFNRGQRVLRELVAAAQH